MMPSCRLELQQGVLIRPKVKWDASWWKGKSHWLFAPDTITKPRENRRRLPQERRHLLYRSPRNQQLKNQQIKSGMELDLVAIVHQRRPVTHHPLIQVMVENGLLTVKFLRDSGVELPFCFRCFANMALVQTSRQVKTLKCRIWLYRCL